MLLVLRRQYGGTFAVEVQDQNAGLPRPLVARVLADAFDPALAACFELGLQFLLALLVLCRAQRLTERVPSRDERGAVGLVFRHQACEFGAGLPDVHLEGRVRVDEVFRLHEGLDQFGGYVVHVALSSIG